MESGFSYQAFFRGSTLMVVVPHEDDEINVAGSVIFGARREGMHVICVFLTNGDYEYIPDVRMKEAVRALGVLGVEKQDILFLGYPDGGAHGECSVFNDRRNTEEGEPQTRGSEMIPEFYMRKTGHHHAASWWNLLSDMERVISEYRPSGIISVDLDSHPDHRMCSVVCDHALGHVLRHTKGSYKPVVLKTFAYNLAFEGVKDFYQKNLLSTEINQDKLLHPGLMDNPQLEWSHRIRLPVPEECRTQDLSQNVLFKALTCHMSQKAMRRAEQLINGDQVFWKRRTSNLAFCGTVSVSSGERKYLCDFCTVGFQDIASRHAAYGDYLWLPKEDDRHPWCRCDFDIPQDISAAAFWGNLDEESRIIKGRLSFSTGFQMEIGPLREHGRETFTEFPLQKAVFWVKFEILEQQGYKAGLSEWELLTNRDCGAPVLKICVDGHFAYQWLVSKKRPLCIDAYNPSERSLLWSVNGKITKKEYIQNICQKSSGAITVRVEAVDDPDLWDEVIFLPASLRRIAEKELLLWKSRMISWWENQKEKRPHHQLKQYKIRR